MTNKKTEHTTEDGTTFKVGDRVVRVDRMGNPYVETLGTVARLTKTLIKVTRTNRDRASYRLKKLCTAPDVGDLRVLTDDYQYLLKAGMSERSNYSIIHKETIRLLENAHRLMHNQSDVTGSLAPDPVESYIFLKNAQAKLNEALVRIEEEVFGD